MPEIASTFSNSRGLTLFFVAMFLFSFGMISHNAFADTVVATIPVSGAFGVATNPNTHMTYVANGNSYQIQVIDDTANAVVATVTTASVPSGGSNGGCYTYTVAVNPITNMIYANNGACVYSNHIVPSWIPQTVSVINGTDNSVVAVVQVAATAQQTEPPKPIAVNPTTNKIYVLGSPNQGYNDFVSVINGTSNQVITNIPMPDYTSSDIAINSQTNTIYVLDGSVIHVIDGKTDSIVNNFSWGKSSNEGIGVNTATNRIYVSNSNNSVSVIDGTTHQVIATIQGTTYGFVGVNMVTDKIYVSSSGTTAVSVIDGATNSLVGQVLVGQNPYGIGVNTAMNKIYVGNSGSGTVSVIDGGSSNTSTAPSAPQNLQASAGNSQVSLSWIIPASNGGSAITSYNVYRGTSSGGETLLTSVSASTTSYTDGTVTNGQAYFYKVTAVNSVGQSPQSNEANATPVAPTSGIVLNNIKTTSGTTSSANQMTLANFDAGTGSNQLLLVGTSANNNKVASVTFGGIPLTKVVSSFFNNDAEFWYLKNPSGTGNIVVTMNGPTQAVVGVYSISGVNQTNPIPTHVTRHNIIPNSPKISITTKYQNDWVFDLPSIYGSVTLGSPTCTQQWDLNVPNAITGASSYTAVPSPAIVTCNWTASNGEFWDNVAVEVRASG